MPTDPLPDNAVRSTSDTDDVPIGKTMADFTAEVMATAYFLWEQAGRPSGRHDDFWYKALDQHIQAWTEE